MLADGIGDAFRFDFAGAAVNAGLLVLWRVEVNVVQLRMGDFVNSTIGDFVPVDRFKDIQNLNFHLDIDGKTVQRGNTRCV